jgi:uncharacterized membrane protein
MSARFRLMKWNVAIKPKHIFLIVRWQEEKKAENVSKNEIEIAVTYFLSSLLLIVFFFISFFCVFFVFLACLAQFNVFMVSFGACWLWNAWVTPFLSCLHFLFLLLALYSLCSRLSKMSLTFFFTQKQQKIAICEKLSILTRKFKNFFLPNWQIYHFKNY